MKSSYPASVSGDLGELLAGHGDLEILVHSSLLTEEEVDRPTGGDAPWCLHAREQRRNLLGTPSLPEAQVRLERPCGRRFFERQPRHRAASTRRSASS